MKKKKIDSPGGAGRGNKGKAVIDDDRPECRECGGFLKSNGKRQYKCGDCGAYQEKNPKYVRLQKNEVFSWGFNTIKGTEHARKCEKGSRLIVTAAQHNTDPDVNFLRSLKQAAKFYNCELAIIPIHYQNKDASEDEEYKKEWHKTLQPYLVHTDIIFSNHLIRSDVRINATTIHPLAGKQAHGGDMSVVFGHPQIAMEPVPTPADHMPKRLFTTGAVTIPNYTITDAGEKARFHHAQGALILEKVKDTVFVRQLNCDDTGAFYDLDRKFTPRTATEGHKALSLVTGDEHTIWNIVERETYQNKTSIVKTLKPEYIIRHDILDGYAGSHHHKKNPMVQFKKFHAGTDDYREEIEHAVTNHHSHLEQYLSTADANKDHRNALFILEMQTKMREACLAGEDYDPFMLYVRDKLKCQFEFLSRNEACLIGGVDVSQHGDVGTNGSRGSARGLSRATYKMTIGHSHSARIVQGVYQVGTSTGRLEYERGLSDHSNTHVIQYQNGKRSIIDIIDGKWCKR